MQGIAAVVLLTKDEGASDDGSTGMETGHERVKEVQNLAMVVDGGLNRCAGERSSRGTRR